MAREKYIEGSIRLEEKKLDMGFFGRIFGIGDNALKQIMGLIAVILILGIVLATFFMKKDDAIAFIAILSPLFTLVFGYLAGAIRN